jgi:hypothetical protein
MIACIPDCELPDVLTEQIGILTYFILTGNQLYGNGVFTRCKDQYERYPGIMRHAIVGDFDENKDLKLDVIHEDDSHPQLGAGAIRRFIKKNVDPDRNSSLFGTIPL